ncbi:MULTISPECIES: Dam family site-specific DNA-(adenine-N6)-methyltransferase [Helicobacter]|uniref:site-specific DNA-methyltransferase (adenine-specific) n=1 Tax=Helicobacter ganmani TaxID=60246 RepID=A0A3D8IF76_9HELI|nr:MULTISPECIES: Dam family site-specific DNA-(adenine-N6)-methyltransferase [Helicobacter]RDU63877.1 DNA methyltransferase [Helicobacter ganmani]
MNPIIKYRGGKSKEIPYFVKNMPNKYARYIEPFFGGGALYFYLQPRKAIINDINTKLYCFYKELQENSTLARAQLMELQGIYEKNQQKYEALKNANYNKRIENANEALYYHLRDAFNGKKSLHYLESVLYYFINKTAYSGMIRYNLSGEYNVPFGRYKHFNTKLITDEHYKLLQSAEIYNEDYAQIFKMANERDFVFLDPPYDCIFSDYGNKDYKNGFGEAEHRRLASDFKNISSQTMLVIGKTPLTMELYRKYIIEEYDKNYSVNIKNRFKSAAKHLIITNYRKD